MKQSNRLTAIFSTLIAVTIGLVAFLANATNECGQLICLSLPSIVSGQVVDETYYTGSIELASTFHDTDLITNKTGYYSIDGGQNWSSTPTTANYVVLAEIPAAASAAAFSDGTFIMVWQEGNAVYSRKFDKSGTPLVAKSAVASGLVTGSYFPIVVSTTTDDYIVFWVNGYTLQTKVYTKDGVLIRSATVYQGGPESDMNPSTHAVSAYSVSVTASGKILLGIKRFNDYSCPNIPVIMCVPPTDTFDYRLYFFDPKTAAMPASHFYQSPIVSAAGGLDVKALDESNYVFLYGNGSTVTLVRFNGVTPLPAQVISTSASSAKVAAAESGEHMIAWVTNADKAIHVQKYTADGATIRTSYTVASGAIADIVYLENGYYLLSYIDAGNLKFTRINPDVTFATGSLGLPYSGNKAGLFALGNSGVVTPISASASGLLPFEKKMSSGVIDPVADFGVTDLRVQFKLVEQTSGTEWLSETRSYLYANPANDGQNGSISYPNGYLSSATVPVHVAMQCSTCITLQLYQSSAPLIGDVCGVFGEYTTYGGNSTLNRDVLAAVEDNRCYRYQAAVTNSFGSSFIYTSANVLMVDRTGPNITVESEQIIGDQLDLMLNVQDVATGVIAQSYQVNGGAKLPFSGNGLSVTVINGLNRVTIEAQDKAGNVGDYDHFSLVDLTAPSIEIHGIEEGGVYGTDLSFTYTLTQQLTNVTMTVDGVPRTDLVGLADGVHTLKIQGYDAQGNLVEKTVTFTVNSNLFSLTILSPQDRLYDTNDIQVDFTASKPTTDVWYSLNGGPATRNMQLSNLADGIYDLVLYANSNVGETASRSVRFTVKNGIPFLQVASPVEGKVYTENKVSVVFASDSPVSYRLGDKSGTLTSGSTLTIPADGQYTLTLSATHPVSGNVVSQAINFTTDTVAPQIAISSPVARLYTFDSVPVTYTSNKPLSDTEYFLDGNQVATLSGLTTGAHTFEIRGRDSAGRVAQQRVQFTVTAMEIFTPQAGQKVVSNSMPPQVPFSYGASGGFTSFTVSVDQGPKQLLANPPGSTTPIVSTPGDHEIALQGRMNEFVSVKRTHFTLGAMNLSAGRGSIDYSYENCDASTNVCDVYATVSIKNTGYYDVNQPITLRFDHIAGTGFETQWQTLSGLAVGQTQTWTLEAFRAALGDTLSLSIDPYRDITNEWSGDNFYSVSFQTGQITGVTQELSQANVYLEGVSIFNPIAVETAGSVSSVELLIGGWTFVDDDGANGFNLLADMGLLGSNSQCIQVIARNDAGIAMDSRNLCFNTTHLASDEVTKLVFPWDQFTSAPKLVEMDSFSLPDLAATLAGARFVALQKSASIFAALSDDGIVGYRLMADPAAVQQQPYALSVDTGTTLFDGLTEMPNGHGMLLAYIIPSSNTCAIDGAFPILTRPRTADLRDLYQKELDQVNIFQRGLDQLTEEYRDELNGVKGLNLISAWSGGAFLGYDLNIGEDLKSDNAFLDLLADLVVELDRHAAVDYKTAWILSGWNSNIASVSEDLGVTYDFAGISCVNAGDIGNFDLSTQGTFRIRLDSKTNLNLNGQNIDLLGAGDLFIGDVPLLVTSTILAGGVSVHPQSINLLASLDAMVNLAAVNQQFYIGPFTAGLQASVHHQGRLADADIVAYPIVTLGLLGLGGDAKFDLYLDGSVSADVVGGNDGTSNEFTNHEFHYATFDGNLKQCTRPKVCVLGACWKGDWKCEDNSIDQNPNGVQVDGAPYTDNDVNAIVRQYDPVYVSSISDLTALGLYTFISGDTQLAQDYLSCGVFQKIAMSMPYGNLYSLRTGQCARVTEPDYEAVGGTTYYGDAACQHEVDYKATPFLTYCQNNLLEPTNHQYIGNAAAWPDEAGTLYPDIGKNSKWTLGHGPTLDALALSPDGNYRPFMKQVEYRNIDNCHLEMRIYKKNILDENLKPAMLIHGGAFKYRGFGAIGGETLISHLTERGFVVFEPYYRLMGSADGPAECQIAGPVNNVTPGEMIVDDIDYALGWVKSHGATLGAQPGAQVSLIGQSSGAYLSGWLATHHAADINKMMIFYPPADIKFYVQNFGEGKLYPPTHEGRDVIEEFLAIEDLEAMDKVNLAPFVEESAFPALAQQDANHPPTFMIHGNADTLVPIEVTARMCDAFKGTLDTGSAMTKTQIEAGGRYTCGTRRGVSNVLHIVDGANHILDLKCIVDPAITSALGDNFKDLKMLCPSGSPATSEYIVKPAILEGMDWLR